jgi:hypothetical protein
MSRHHTVAGPPVPHLGDDNHATASHTDSGEATENVANWLQDVARRPWPQEGRPARTRPSTAAPDPGSVASGAAAPAARATMPRKWPVVIRHGVIMTALAGAFMQYYFIEVNLRIVSMHSVTVFAPVAAVRAVAARVDA